MKIRRLIALLWLPPTLAILSAGCASHHPMVNTWSNAQFSPTRADKMGLTLRPNPSPEDAELGRLLVAELKLEGFDLVPIEKADYLLTYVLEDNWTVDEQNRITTSVVPPPQTTQQMFLPPQAQTPSAPISTVSTPIVFHSKGIRLYLYTNPQTRPGGLQIAWQGYIDAGNTVSAERETVLIRTLLGCFGQEQHRRVDLAQ